MFCFIGILYLCVKFKENVNENVRQTLFLVFRMCLN